MFDAQGLMVAEIDSVPIGFVHAVKSEENSDNASIPPFGLINALCVSEHPDEAMVANELLKAAEAYLHSRNVHDQVSTTSPDRFAFYLGVGESGGLLGVSARDRRQQQWLEAAGYRSQSMIETWQLPLSAFRPPMDRVQIMIRRQSRVELIDHGAVPHAWWRSVLLGHAEVSTFRFTTRGENASIDVDFWQPEFAVQNGAACVFLNLPSDIEQEKVDHYAFLISDGLKHFQQGRVPRVRTTIYSNAQQNSKLLERLGFRKELQGMVYSKPIS
jgi:hypothetical protein